MNSIDLLQRCRHPSRMRSSQLIARLAPDYTAEASPDPALLYGNGTVGGRAVTIFAQEKPQGREARKAAEVNYGMMSATGYWFVVEQLEKLSHDRPVLFVVDTPGADPSKRGAENLLAWSVAASIRALLAFHGPTVSLVLGEGGSGGALGLQVADRRLMASDAIFSTISPESCSAILFHKPDRLEESMRILRPTAGDMLQIGIIDEVVAMDDGAMLQDHDAAARVWSARVAAAFNELCAVPTFQRLKRRRAAYLQCGRRAAGQDSGAMRPGAEPALLPPPMQKFSAIDEGGDGLASIRSAYYSSKAKGERSNEKMSMVCPPDQGGCGVLFSREAYQTARWSCPSCGRGERLDSRHWLQILCGDAPFEEMHAGLELQHLDHAGYDNAEYRAQRAAVTLKTGLVESMRVGVGEIHGIRAALAISDFRFFGGTLGAVAGEKLALLAQHARQEGLPLVTVTCSGGVRMQDGTLGLAQMAKTVAALDALLTSGLACVSVLADPCTGGALGSYATAASTVLAEPGALVAFAGPRVMRLAGLPVNEPAMLSNRLVEYGGVDEIVPRSRMQARIWRYIQLNPVRAHRSPRAGGKGAAPDRLKDMNYWFDELMTRASAALQDHPTDADDKLSSSVPQATLVARLSDLALISIPLLLEQAASSADPRIRANAMESLARFPAHDRAHLVAGLRDEHHRVRANAALALLRQNPDTPEALEAIKGLLASEESVQRRAALFAVARTPVPALLFLVHDACRDPDDTVAIFACVALFSYGEEANAQPQLLRALDRIGPSGERTARHLLPFMPEKAARILAAALDKRH